MTDGYDDMAMGVDDGALKFQAKINTDHSEQVVEYVIPAEDARQFPKFRLVATTSGGGSMLQLDIQGGHEEIDGPNTVFIAERSWRVWPKEE